MRLIGSFHTMVVHDRSASSKGSVTPSTSGRSTSTGALVTVPSSHHLRDVSHPVAAGCGTRAAPRGRLSVMVTISGAASGTPGAPSSALLTDHYELTMVQAALRSGAAHRRSVFEVFARRLPDGRRYGVVAGTARVLEAIAAFRFDDAQLAFFDRTGVVDR